MPGTGFSASCEPGSYLYVAIDLSTQQSSVWSDRLSDQIGEDIRTGAMSDSLRAGDFTGGLVAALDDAGQALVQVGQSVDIERDDAGGERIGIGQSGIPTSWPARSWGWPASAVQRSFAAVVVNWQNAARRSRCRSPNRGFGWVLPASGTPG